MRKIDEQGIQSGLLAALRMISSCNRFDSYWRWYNGVAVLFFLSFFLSFFLFAGYFCYSKNDLHLEDKREYILKYFNVAWNSKEGAARRMVSAKSECQMSMNQNYLNLIRLSQSFFFPTRLVTHHPSTSLPPNTTSNHTSLHSSPFHQPCTCRQFDSYLKEDISLLKGFVWRILGCDPRYSPHCRQSYLCSGLPPPFLGLSTAI